MRRIYWWVGVVGTAVSCAGGFGFAVSFLGDGAHQGRKVAPLLAIAVYVGIQAAFFNYCRVVADRLVVEPTRYRRRARLVGFLMAVLYFPVLTVPGLYCVWRIDNQFDEPLKTDAGPRLP